MKKYIYSLVIIVISHFEIIGQNTIEEVLESVRNKNMTIQANNQFWEAKALQFKTGLTLDNPSVSYDYMVGAPVSAGNQTDVAVSQSFDFPTAYARKRELSIQNIAQIEFQKTAVQREVLLEAKKVCIALVYRNKAKNELVRRKLNFEAQLVNFQQKLQKGDGSILDVNKAQLQLIEINKELQAITSEINQGKQQLMALNGGEEIHFNDTTYSITRILPAFDVLVKEIEEQDVMRKVLEQKRIISNQRVALSKSLALPKFELGYHYQGILGQSYQGAHFGLTIPLWENKNVIKTSLAENDFAALKLKEYNNELYFQMEQFYEKYTNLSISIQQYQSVFTTFNHSKLLDKSLKLGQITAVEYFMEKRYFFISYDGYLETEFELQIVIAELTKNELG